MKHRADKYKLKLFRSKLWCEAPAMGPSPQNTPDLVMNYNNIDIQLEFLSKFNFLFCIYLNLDVQLTMFYQLQIEVTHRMFWRASDFRHHCNQSTIRSRDLTSSHRTLLCQNGCNGTVGNMSYYCTDFSTSEDWTTGERTYTYNATEITSFEAS